MGITISNSQGVWLGFSLKNSPYIFMGNMGINSVGTESVFQTGQAGRTECLAGVLCEGLTREILASHNCLHLA